MVIQMAVSPLTQELVFIPVNHDDTWPLFQMLKDANLHRGLRVACWNGYEDCIVFQQEN